MALPITSLDDLINSLTTSGQQDDFCFFKVISAPVAAGIWHSTWKDPGCPGDGATDSGGTQYVNGSGGSGASANKGGFGFHTINVSPQGRVLTAISALTTQIASIIIADRLCAIGPVTVSSTGSKTLTTLPALPRNAAGNDVEAWLEVTTTFSGATAGSFYLDSYTGNVNGAGQNATSGSAMTFPVAAAKAGDMLGPLTLVAGDTGVRTIASFNVSAAPTGGALNVVLLRRLATLIPVVGLNAGNTRNMLSQVNSLPVIADGATLFVMVQAATTSVPLLHGNLCSAVK